MGIGRETVRAQRAAVIPAPALPAAAAVLAAPARPAATGPAILRRRPSWTLTVAVAAALLTAACGAAEEPPAPDGGGSTDDHVTVELRPSPEAEELEYTLTCGEQPQVEGEYGGRITDPSAACDALAASSDRLALLTATPEPDEVCTEIYGGDQQATVTGTVAGQSVQAELSRANGCRIADWDALEPLLGPGGV